MQVTTLWRMLLLLACCLGAVGTAPVKAQPAADVAAVSAANAAFYTALSARDAAAMAQIYAHTDYVANVGPRSTAILFGWPAVEGWAKSLANIFETLDAKSTSARVRVNGRTAWVMNTEHASGKLKSGGPVDWDLISTNVFEKIEGRWLMVSHHAMAPMK